MDRFGEPHDPAQAQWELLHSKGQNNRKLTVTNTEGKVICISTNWLIEPRGLSDAVIVIDPKGATGDSDDTGSSAKARAPVEGDMAEQLTKLVELRNIGVLSEEEFEQAKAGILAGGGEDSVEAAAAAAEEAARIKEWELPLNKRLTITGTLPGRSRLLSGGLALSPGLDRAALPQSLMLAPLPPFTPPSHYPAPQASPSGCWRTIQSLAWIYPLRIWAPPPSRRSVQKWQGRKRK